MNIRLLFPIMLIMLASCGNGHEVIHPTVKPLIEAVYASGYVAAQDEYEIFAQVDGYLAEKLVNDGDVVKKGDVIFIIESGQQSARFKIAQDNFALARKNSASDSPVFQELEAAIASVRSKVKFDSLNFIRYTNLLKQNATTKLEYDRFKLQYENSQNEYRLQTSRLGRLRDQVSTELKNAQAQLQIAGDESGRYLVRSDIDGKIFVTTKEKGELIRRGERIAIAGQDKNFYLQLSIDELDIQRIKKGQSVKVKIDAYPGKIFDATIDKIYPMVNMQQQSLRADALFNDVLPAEFSGLAVEANIIIREKKDALVVPKVAVMPGDSMLVRRDGDEQKIKIVKGIETLDEVEIIEGITLQQEVLVKK